MGLLAGDTAIFHRFASAAFLKGIVATPLSACSARWKNDVGCAHALDNMHPGLQSQSVVVVGGLVVVIVGYACPLSAELTGGLGEKEEPPEASRQNQ